MTLDKITLKNWTVECVVGVYPSERLKSQKLTVAVDLFLDTRPASLEGLNKSVDYARLCGEIEFLLKACRFCLLEEAADTLARYLLASPPPSLGRVAIDEVEICLSKGEALEGKACPSLTIRRRRGEYEYTEESNVFGKVDILCENSYVGVYWLRVAPGSVISTHHHKVMEESELVLTDSLRLQGQRVLPGSGFTWPLRFPHRYNNESTVEQVVLCVDRPSFIREDEVADNTPLEALELPEPEFYFPKEVAL